jgi:AraC-like DNA-binding protein
MLPGAAEAVFDACQRHLMLLVRRTLLRSLLTEEQWTRLESTAARRCLGAPPPIRDRLGLSLGGLLSRVLHAPSMLHHHAAVQALEEETVQGLFNAVSLPAGQEPPARASMRRRGFDRAIEHIRQAGLTRLSLPTLSAAAGVSPRTLEYAFQEQLGLSPASFVRMLRLHALRRALLAGRLGVSTVTEVAHHLGFTQLGRLAREYRLAFGERPSATLARPLRDDTPSLWDPAFDPAPRPHRYESHYPRD